MKNGVEPCFREPAQITVVECDNLLQRRVYSAAVRSTPIRFASAMKMHGWHSAYVAPVPTVNHRIAAQRLFPEEFSIQDGENNSGLRMSGCFSPWRVLPGGAGRNLYLLLPLCDVLVAHGEADGNEESIAELAATVAIDLVQLQAGATDEASSLRPLASVVRLADDGNALSRKNKIHAAALVEQWCLANIDTIRMVLGAVAANDATHPDTMGFACLDTGDPDSCLFGVLEREPGSEGKQNRYALPGHCVENAPVLWVDEDSHLCARIMRDLPILRRLDADEIRRNEAEGGFVVAARQLADVKGINRSFSHRLANCRISFVDWFAKLSLDIEVTLSSGIVVHLIVDAKCGIKLVVEPSGKKTFRHDPAADVEASHYIDLPAGTALTESMKQEVSEAADAVIQNILL